MGAFSIWHVLILLVVGLSFFGLGGLLPLIIKPSGPNRFGPAAVPLTFGAAFVQCLKKYADFKGRASRSEYWWFYLGTLLVYAVLGVADNSAGHSGLVSLVSLAFFIPSLAAGARRLHDINRSGLWLLLMFTGFGAIALIILMALPSQPEDVAQVFE